MRKLFTFFLALTASVGMSWATTNSININESSHGSVVASSSSAAAGETITLTATPDDGYQLKSIRVYVPVFETLNNTALTVNGNKFQAQATLRNGYGWRVYNPGTAQTLTVSSLNGTTLINKIEFTATMGDQRTNDMLSVSAGTLSFDGNNPSTTVTINDINATSVTISGSGNNNAKTWNINSVKVYTDEVVEISDTENANVKTFTMVDSEVTISAEFAPAAYDVTANLANGAYWATFYSNAGNYQAPSGTQVFAVNLDGTTITMIPVEDRIAKSGQGVVLKQATESSEPTTTITITMTPTETAATDSYFSGNSLTGTMTDITNPSYGSVYVLNKGTQGVGFYKLQSDGTIGANKAYLTYSGGAGAREFFAFNEATGIESIDHSPLTIDHSVYDLQGRRVLNPTKGLYIVNRKKVFINK